MTKMQCNVTSDVRSFSMTYVQASDVGICIVKHTVFHHSLSSQFIMDIYEPSGFFLIFLYFITVPV